MKWYPWVEVKNELPPDATNGGYPINEPPCKFCKHFKPQVSFRNTPNGYAADGVRICHAGSMHHDFSCFTEREDA